MHALYQQLRKAQYELDPPFSQPLNGYNREFFWYTGQPYWTEHDHPRGQYWEHPDGYERDWQCEDARWHWDPVSRMPDTISFGNLTKRIVEVKGEDGA